MDLKNNKTMENKRAVRVTYKNGVKHTLRSNNKRVEISKMFDCSDIEITIKRLRKDMKTKDGHFGRNTESKGLMTASLRLTEETAKEVFTMLYYLFQAKQ